MENVAVYAEKYTICTVLGNMRIMQRSHIRIKPACLTMILQPRAQAGHTYCSAQVNSGILATVGQHNK